MKICSACASSFPEDKPACPACGEPNDTASVELSRAMKPGDAGGRPVVGAVGAVGEPEAAAAAPVSAAATVDPNAGRSRASLPWGQNPSVFAAPDEVPMVDANENHFLGASPYTLKSGEALTSLSKVGGILMLAIFFLPWIMTSQFTFWSWSSLPDFGRGGGDGPFGALGQFILWYPLFVGAGLLAASRAAIPPIGRAAILLLAGALPILILNTKLMSIGLTAGSDTAIGMLRYAGMTALGVGLTLRALRTNTRIGRHIILGGAIAYVLGFIIPVKTGFTGESTSLLKMSWTFLSSKYLPGTDFKIPGALRVTGMFWLFSFVAAGLALITLPAQTDPYSDRGLGTAKFLGFFFIFMIPLGMMLVMLTMMDSGAMFAVFWLLMKLALYFGLTQVWLNHGVVGLIELGKVEAAPGIG